LEPYDVSYNGNLDCFLLKVDPSDAGGNQVRYATFLGSSFDEEAFGLDVFQDVFYTCGYTNSYYFPVGSSENDVVFDNQYEFEYDAFVTKLNPRASPRPDQLAYSTFLGGGGDDIAFSIKRVQDRVVVVVGWTSSLNFPTGYYPNGTPFNTTHNGIFDVFLTRLVWKISRDLPSKQLDYSTFIGGGDFDQARSLSMDGVTNAYIGGWTMSGQPKPFPTSANAYDDMHNGASDGFACWFELPPLAN
jgi:hypothetical protein